MVGQMPGRWGSPCLETDRLAACQARQDKARNFENNTPGRLSISDC